MFWHKKPKAKKPQHEWVAVERESGWYIASTTSDAGSGPHGEAYAKSIVRNLNEQLEASRSVRV